MNIILDITKSLKTINSQNHNRENFILLLCPVNYVLVDKDMLMFGTNKISCLFVSKNKSLVKISSLVLSRHNVIKAYMNVGNYESRQNVIQA